VSRFLIDEMFPPLAAQILRDEYGHDALHVCEAGLQATADDQVTAVARAEDRAIVTENFADYAAERDVILLFVRKDSLPPGGAMAKALASLLEAWAQGNPEPYVGSTGRRRFQGRAVARRTASAEGDEVPQAASFDAQIAGL
jgi:hypothetical protein